MTLSRIWRSRSLAGGLSALALGILIAAVGAAGTALPVLNRLEERAGLHWLYGSRGALEAPASVVIVAIDEQSARELGLQELPRTWPRSLHAELVRYLVGAGARVIAFDLTFDSPSAVPSHDAEFAAAIRAAGNVLLAEAIRREELVLPGPDARRVGRAVIERPSLPIAPLQEAAVGSAPFLLPKDAEVNSYWAFRDDAGRTPTLPVLALQVHARDAVRDFAAVLRKTDPDLAAAWSAAGAVPGQAGSPGGAAWRDLLRVGADTRARLAGRLAEAGAAGLSEERRRLLQTLLDVNPAEPIRYLNFYGPPRTIETVPFSVVLGRARSVPAASRASDATFRDRAVFIGYAAATPDGQDRLRDDYRTVFSDGNGLNLSGVEIAATAFANLVEGRALRPLAPAWQFVLVVAFGLTVGVLCRLLRPIWAALATALLCGAWLWVARERFVDAAAWLPSVLPVGVQAPLALFAGVWLHYRDTVRERQLVKRAFGYYIPSGVVDQIARDPGPLTRNNRVVYGACLSTDVEKYTAIAEGMDPARLGALLNEYYAQLFVPVERSNGVVVDVVGDAMVAVWAKVSSTAQVCRQACEAALEIAAALDRFNGAPQRPALPTRFGLHAGDMLFGSIGASGHYEYRAVGDIVNTASRIQGLNKVLGTRLLASAATVHGLDDLRSRPLGSFLLAGKANPVAIVELISRESSVDAGAADLCRRFAGALEAYAERRFEEAARRFAAILDAHPDDGPSRFYRAHCERLCSAPPNPAWTATIAVDSK